jgi:hypothetical protein
LLTSCFELWLFAFGIHPELRPVDASLPLVQDRVRDEQNDCRCLVAADAIKRLEAAVPLA